LAVLLFALVVLVAISFIFLAGRHTEAYTGSKDKDVVAIMECDDVLEAGDRCRGRRLQPDTGERHRSGQPAALFCEAASRSAAVATLRASER
jgi:hypothetical protein